MDIAEVFGDVGGQGHCVDGISLVYVRFSELVVTIWFGENAFGKYNASQEVIIHFIKIHELPDFFIFCINGK